MEGEPLTGVSTMVIWPWALIQCLEHMLQSLSIKTPKHVVKFVHTALGCRTLSKTFYVCQARLTKLWFFRCVCSRESQVLPHTATDTPGFWWGLLGSLDPRTKGLLVWLWYEAFSSFLSSEDVGRALLLYQHHSYPCRPQSHAVADD